MAKTRMHRMKRYSARLLCVLGAPVGAILLDSPSFSRLYKPCDDQIQAFVESNASPTEMIRLAKHCQDLATEMIGRRDEQYWVVSSYYLLAIGQYNEANKDAGTAYLLAYSNALSDKTGTGEWRAIPAMLMAVSRYRQAVVGSVSGVNKDNQFRDAIDFARRALAHGECKKLSVDSRQGKKPLLPDKTLDAETRFDICSESHLVIAASDRMLGNQSGSCERLRKFRELLVGATERNNKARVSYSALSSKCGLMSLPGPEYTSQYSMPPEGTRPLPALPQRLRSVAAL